MRGLIVYSLFAAGLVSAGPLPDSPPAPPASEPSPEEIIQKFAAKEAEFRKARENYTYRQSVKMEELDPDGNVQGKWEITSDIIFGPNKQRIEKVIYAPMITLKSIGLTPQDEQDLRAVQPFVLTTEDVGKYEVHYTGKENADEIPCFTFSVKPKKMVKGERYFEGKIWVDDRDFQIVKTFGKGVGLIDAKTNQFPQFETYRQQVDGKYWFPVYTHADDVLHFQSMSQRIRMVVKYQNYKRFGSETSVTFGDEVTEPKTPPKQP